MMITMNFILLALVVVVFVAINQTSAGNYPIQLDNGLIPVGNTTLSRGNLDNSTDTKLLKRSKRWYLIWSGISKVMFIFGFLKQIRVRSHFVNSFYSIAVIAVCSGHVDARRDARQRQLAYVEYGAQFPGTISSVAEHHMAVEGVCTIAARTAPKIR